MALKGDRNIWADGYSIEYFMNVVGEPGVIVVHNTSGSGASMDDGNHTVVIPTGASTSGTSPAGLLLTNVVNLDLTRQHVNEHRDEAQVGSKVTLCRHGWVVTNMIAAGVNPTAGDDAYYAQNGLLTNVNPMDGATNANLGVNYHKQKVGQFLSSEDADGYCKVEINF